MSSLRLETLEARTTPSTLLNGFSETTLTRNLHAPTSLAVMPDGRLLISEQDGDLRIVQNDQLLATPALSLAVDSSGERGLLGVAIDPFFSGNTGFVYLFYTSTSGNQRVSRFLIEDNTIRPGSEVVLLTIPDSPDTSTHNGGALHFGADGKLYIGVGDDGLSSNAQSLSDLHGKILRINADGTIPTDNPFYNIAKDDNRAIWIDGLRNPIAFDIQPDTGRILVNDGGLNNFEEIDCGLAGHNYGSPATEGDFDSTQFPNFTLPIVSYPHTSGIDGAFSLTGAAFYPAKGGTFPGEYAGDYFFADQTNNWIRALNPATNQATLFASNIPGGLVDLDVSADGSLLVLSHDGSITRIALADRQPPSIAQPISVLQPPTILQPPSSVTIDKTQGVTFYATATGSLPFSYQWQRDGTDIPGATKATYTLMNAQTTDSGATFRVVVSNDAGNDTSGSATLTVLDVTPALPSSVLVGTPQYAVGVESGGRDLATLFNANQTTRFTVTPYESSFTGGVRTAAADFNGDGVADLVVASGPGRTGNARIYDGVTQKILFDINPFGDSFTRGINISAGDLNRDGKAELILSAERGGGARLRIFTPTANGFAQLSDYFALIGGDGVADTNFRGGARTAVGDINGDGFGDLIFAAGAGGGPRIAIYSGQTINSKGGTKLVGDFFAFDPSLRDGANVSAGDFDGDGFAELVAAAGPGGAPRVSLFLGSALTANKIVRLQDFFIGNVNSRNGLRVAVKNLDGDASADLVAGSDDGTVFTYRGSDLVATSSPSPFNQSPAFAGYNGGVFVG